MMSEDESLTLLCRQLSPSLMGSQVYVNQQAVGNHQQHLQYSNRDGPLSYSRPSSRQHHHIQTVQLTKTSQEFSPHHLRHQQMSSNQSTGYSSPLNVARNSITSHHSNIMNMAPNNSNFIHHQQNSSFDPIPLSILPNLYRLDPKQHFNYLGKSGLKLSCIGFGTWVTFGAQISDEVAEEILTLAYNCGINIFDTAEVYAAGKAELLLGRILKKKGWRRSSYVITTKIFWGGKAETEKGLSRKHIIEGLQNCLERLQLNYVDIVFANKPDPHTPIEEVVRAFSFVINQGWSFYWGVSRWSSVEVFEAQTVARQFNLIPPVAQQEEYNIFHRDKVELGSLDLYARIGLGSITWSPLSCGFISGKYDDGIPVMSRASLKGYSWLKEKILSHDGRKQQAKLKQLSIIAEKLECSLAQLSIAWCLKQEVSHCVLLGASSPDQLYEDICALQIVPKLTPAVLHEIEKILGNKPGTLVATSQGNKSTGRGPVR